MQCMPADLVVEETCKLLLQLDPAWSITGADHVVAFVEQMKEHFDATLQDLLARNAMVAQAVPPDDWGDEVEDEDEDTQNHPTDHEATGSDDDESTHFGQSSAKMRVEAQRLFSDSKIQPPRRTRSAVAWTAGQQRQSRAEQVRRFGDDARKFVLLLALMWQVYSIPFLSAFVDTVPWPVILGEYIVDAVFWLNIFFHIRDPFGWYPDFFEFCTSRRQYLRGYFWVELCAVLPMELPIWACLQTSRSLGGFGRLNRLITIVHFSHTFDHTLRLIWKSLNPSSVRVYWLATLLLMYFHCMACMFFGALATDMDSFRQFLQEDRLGHEGVVSSYLTAFDTTVKMSTGFAAQYPITDLQNAISLCVALGGFAVYSYVLGCVIYIISQQDAPLTLLRTKLEMVHDYMDYIKAPRDLSEEILSYYRQVWKICHSFDTERQDFLEDLPPELQQRIQFTINYSLVQRVNIFQSVKDDMMFIADIVSSLKPRVCVPEQVVVHAHSANSEMYFIMKGELEALDANGNVVATLKEGQYFGELCLLYGIPTTHTIVATTTCYLYTLSQKDFDYLMEQYPQCLKEILGNALAQMEDAALSDPESGDEGPLVADGLLLDRNGRAISVVSPRESLGTGTLHGESRSAWGAGRSDRQDPLSPSGNDRELADFASSYRFGVSDVREMLKERPVTDVMDLLADMRAEAKAAFQETHSPRPPDARASRDFNVPAVRPSGSPADPLAVGNSEAALGQSLRLGQSTRLGASMRSLGMGQSMRSVRSFHRPSPPRSSPNTRRASVGSNRRSSIPTLFTAARRVSLAGSVALGGGNQRRPSRTPAVGRATASPSGLPPIAVPSRGADTANEEGSPSGGGVVDGLMRLVKGARNNVSLSDLAKERTRNGLGTGMEVRCVTTFDVDGLLESPRSSRMGSPPRVVLEGATVTVIPPTVTPDHNESEASDRSQSFTIAQETLQLTRPRMKDKDKDALSVTPQPSDVQSQGTENSKAPSDAAEAAGDPLAELSPRDESPRPPFLRPPA